MVTIGTNLYNTVENLTEMVEFLNSNGCTVILNHIYRWSDAFKAEHGSEQTQNTPIESVCETYHLRSVRFDIATSQDYDLSKSRDETLYDDDVHLNAKGNIICFNKIKTDLPEFFEL